ncbi:MAG TPA: hypothetical protein DCS07_02880 [Bdellovibrionales bacterium]|nr:MAG: hypothetical protein A2Z97_07740 [Bdellovibrionales bacterium GWB1_52_6]OFZ04771.1 MAG: hypothetical protein A2X97_13680 [Bdellovibrionales bacterium GWA1_52_35]OFZ43402.1 MAG: hypothetical protein A2070_09805 [Bdellovibrionales bacterium GWC1_52_8]HAR41567.1 hypothetical protein [Bdellovibrionales bacterium]HCM39585.1 hypothetical protein [Bdellovibrionales bacterium]
MDTFSFIDIYATKGIEYVIAVVFLVVVVIFQKFFAGKSTAHKTSILTHIMDWFRIPEEVHVHQGHAWARLESKNQVAVGMDDFAQKFVGRLDSIELPKIGTALKQGETGWTLKIGSKTVPMLSPVDGVVVAINQAALENPDLINNAPYETGWLLKIAPTKLDTNTRNLLPGRVARMWMQEILTEFDSMKVDQPGPQDMAMKGIARMLSEENWDELAKKHFLTHDISDDVIRTFPRLAVAPSPSSPKALDPDRKSFEFWFNPKSVGIRLTG